jgi:hypothetical protein
MQLLHTHDTAICLHHRANADLTNIHHRANADLTNMATATNTYAAITICRLVVITDLATYLRFFL